MSLCLAERLRNVLVALRKATQSEQDAPIAYPWVSFPPGRAQCVDIGNFKQLCAAVRCVIFQYRLAVMNSIPFLLSKSWHGEVAEPRANTRGLPDYSLES